MVEMKRALPCGAGWIIMDGLPIDSRGGDGSPTRCGLTGRGAQADDAANPASGERAMAKLRHIALSVSDVNVAKEFFEKAFDMEFVSRRGDQVVYMSDGTMNVALIDRQGRPLGWEKDELFYGIDHFGMWVDDVKEARAKVEAAGAKWVMGNEAADENSFYEIKYRDPLGNLFDITANGWAGAVKDVVPAAGTKAPAKAAAE
jgi:methylmalonyl-CoA/ethylmalonyl-CoA epimerase